MAKIDMDRLDIPELGPSVKRMERDRILYGLFATKSNKTLLAKKLGIARTTLDRKIAEYQLGAEREE